MWSMIKTIHPMMGPTTTNHRNFGSFAQNILPEKLSLKPDYFEPNIINSLLAAPILTSKKFANPNFVNKQNPNLLNCRENTSKINCKLVDQCSKFIDNKITEKELSPPPNFCQPSHPKPSTVINENLSKLIIPLPAPPKVQDNRVAEQENLSKLVENCCIAKEGATKASEEPTVVQEEVLAPKEGTDKEIKQSPDMCRSVDIKPVQSSTEMGNTKAKPGRLMEEHHQLREINERNRAMRRRQGHKHSKMDKMVDPSKKKTKHSLNGLKKKKKSKHEFDDLYVPDYSYSDFEEDDYDDDMLLYPEYNVPEPEKRYLSRDEDHLNFTVGRLYNKKGSETFIVSPNERQSPTVRHCKAVMSCPPCPPKILGACQNVTPEIKAVPNGSLPYLRDDKEQTCLDLLKKLSSSPMKIKVTGGPRPNNTVIINITPPSKVCRQRQISECSEDSFIVFDDGEILSRDSIDSEEYDSDSYDSESCCSDDVSPCAIPDYSDLEDDSIQFCEPNCKSEGVCVCPPAKLKKKVSFAKEDDLCTIHPMVKWSFAYRTARKGPWEECARDRERFKLRVMRSEFALNEVLEPEHREKIYQERFVADKGTPSDTDINYQLYKVSIYTDKEDLMRH